jgi:uncharacterized membrane protein YeaQ/YmgE (transglycosylase-associated protein family)
MSLLILLAIAAGCGALGQALAGYSLGGCLISMVIGFIGAVLGGWLAGVLGLPAFIVIDVGGEPFPIIWAVVGSALFALVVGAVSRPRRYV